MDLDSVVAEGVTDYQDQISALDFNYSNNVSGIRKKEPNQPLLSVSNNSNVANSVMKKRMKFDVSGHFSNSNSNNLSNVSASFNKNSGKFGNIPSRDQSQATMRFGTVHSQNQTIGSAPRISSQAAIS